jgi:hypothetical protein
MFTEYHIVEKPQTQHRRSAPQQVSAHNTTNHRVPETPKYRLKKEKDYMF